MIPRQKPDLAEALRSSGVGPARIEDVIGSGYRLLPSSSVLDSRDSVGVVVDTFYGSTMPASHFDFATFAEYVKGTECPFRYNPRRIPVRSLVHAREVLERPENKRWLDEGRLSFRGQSQEYFTRRPFPNPYVGNDSGEEPLVIPAFWRQFRDDWNSRLGQQCASIFRGLHADEFIYHGIPQWQRLAEINLARYGDHSMSDLEDFPDPESREYYRRYIKFKVELDRNVDIPLVEQHYGIKTNGLDVTFDIGVALFFAVNQARRDTHDRIVFERANSDLPTGVVYMFVFRAPSLSTTQDMVEQVLTFKHLHPERPIRQRCALPFFHDWCINEAICHCHGILEITPDFDDGCLPTAAELFPSPDEDPFYRVALDFRRRNPGRYGDFVEYMV
jgi:hypothetical protein